MSNRHRLRIPKGWSIGPILIVLLLVGCGDSGRSALSGRWQLAAPEKLARRLGPESREGALGPVPSDGMTGQRMELVFGAWGALKTVTRVGSIDREKTGEWDVVSRSPDGRRMTIRCTLNGQTTEHEVEFLDGDRIRLVPPNLAGTDSRLEFHRSN